MTRLKKRLRAGLGARIEQVVRSPIPGLYQVELQGGRLIYGSADGRYLIQGYMYEVEPKGMRNLTAQYGAQRRAEMVKLRYLRLLWWLTLPLSKSTNCGIR